LGERDERPSAGRRFFDRRSYATPIPWGFVPYTVGQFALALQGLALLRGGPTASDEALAARVRELVELTAVLDHPDLVGVAFGSEVGVRDGYADWSRCYDGPNPLIAVEEPAVDGAVATWPTPWRVLDAGCGTGRHCVRLGAAGHGVTGLDASPEMLAVARAKVPAGCFVEGGLGRLPFRDRDFDGAVCALALSHFADPLPVISELARVVRVGGRLVISDFHPFMVLIGGQAAFRLDDGETHFVRSYAHLPGVMLNAFERTDMRVVECSEPTWTFDAASIAFPGISRGLFDEAIAGLPLAIVWHLAV
jgi:SAM-dependent methyltransferase